MQFLRCNRPDRRKLSRPDPSQAPILANRAGRLDSSVAPPADVIHAKAHLLAHLGEAMSEQQSAALSPGAVIMQMKKNGVSHVVWLPDSETNWLFLKMMKEPSLRLIGVSREGHACSVAAGLYAGGARPTILIQNTGMLSLVIPSEVGSSISISRSSTLSDIEAIHGTALIATPRPHTRSGFLWHSTSPFT